jgi:hypothetical protein
MLAKFGKKRKKSKIEKWHLYAGSGFARLAGMTKREPAFISTDARISFEKAFGLNLSRQEALEDLYSRLTKGPLGINHTAFDCLRSSELNCEYLF